jgi:hypothetical protein
MSKNGLAGVQYHETSDYQVQTEGTRNVDLRFDYDFQNFFHPFVHELMQKLNSKDGLPGMLDPQFLSGLSSTFFDSLYETETNSAGFRKDHPGMDKLVGVASHAKEIDLGSGPYADYNWELFFHIPLTIAVHLSKNQRFLEAQRWFHYIFDPTCNDPKITDPKKRCWKFLPFRDGTGVDDLLEILSRPDNDPGKQALLQGYGAILLHPFSPYAVARTRAAAFQYSVVMKYLDNLIAWGDSLFRQDTIETINEATMLYVLAANILGQRPQEIPAPGSLRPMTFRELKEGLDPKNNPLNDPLVDLEAQFPFNLDIPAGNGAAAAGPLLGIGRALYFCVPRNEKLLGYWDTVADRLFKIRNSMNIEGVFRQLALFDPPIDPGLLVKATAAGIDVGSIVSGLNQPIGPVRSLLLIQKSLEVCAEVKSLGGALLSAIEKGDAEGMARLRQTHEIEIQTKTQEVRFLQWKQAQSSTEGLLKSRATALERYKYYLRMLGLSPNPATTPENFALDRRQLTEDNFDEAYSALVGAYEKGVPVLDFPPAKLAAFNSPQSQSGASSVGNLYLNSSEDAELNTHLPAARDTRVASSAMDLLASVLVYIPDFDADLAFWGLGVSSGIFGGKKLHDSIKGGADVLRLASAWETDQAGIASRTATFDRRANELMLQANLAARELMQLGRQIIGSLIAEQVAKHEYDLAQKQVEHSNEVDEYLKDKFSNQELYGWMQGEISRLYYEYYRFAFDTARKAEQSMKRELMRPEVDATDYVKFNYWDGGRKGLLSAEALYLDVKRMELAYHENNKRELELTKNVSLRQLDPAALLALKAGGACQLDLPEWLFDLDGPGHYLRRIKSVSLSIPSVVGPYTSVNCTLTLLKSSVRRSPLLSSGAYARQGSDDDRFLDYVGATESIVTSMGNNDSGMFETNLRDERLLPFEGAGAVSTWKLQLPADYRGFDYDTISDVVLHIRYTARDGGSPLGDKAVGNVKDLVGPQADGLPLVFSLKHDFPTEWSRFTAGGGSFKATIRSDFFPYLTRGKTVTITSLQLYGIKDDQVTGPSSPAGNAPGDLTTALKNNGTFDLALAPDTVLTADTGANVFVLISYTVS